MTYQKSTQFSSQTIKQWDVVVIIIAFSLSLLITVRMGEKTYDDAFITFRYAENLALGQGFVYNARENYLGTTTPLLTLLLACIKIIFPVLLIPAIGQWLTGVALFGLSLFTYWLGRLDRKLIAGGVAALFVLLNPIFVTVWGGESILFLAFIAAAFYFYFRGDEITPAILIGLACLTRGEGILPGLVLFTHYVLVKKKLPWRVIVAFCVTLSPWVLYAMRRFGTPLPSTLQAKMAQMDSGVFAPFFITSLDLLRGYLVGSPNFPGIGPNYTYFVVAILAFIGGVSLLIQPRQPVWWSMLAWVSLYSVGYTWLGVPFYHWYSIPLLYAGILLAGLGAQFVYDFAQKNLGARSISYRRVAFGLLTLIVGLPLITAFNAVQGYVAQPVSQIQSLYSNTGRWLRENTPADARIGYFEIGFMGYYSGQTFVDPVGLINPGVSEQVAQHHFKWAYLHYKPDYLVINPVRWYTRIGNIRDEPWFDTAYQEVGRIEEAGYFDAPIVIYQKINDGAIPVP